MGVLPLWRTHLHSPSVACVEQAMCGIVNIAARGVKERDFVLGVHLGSHIVNHY